MAVNALRLFLTKTVQTQSGNKISRAVFVRFASTCKFFFNFKFIFIKTFCLLLKWFNCLNMKGITGDLFKAK